MGLYGKGMHDFVMSELELGRRAAMGLDNECADGWPPAILGLQFEEYIRGQEEYERARDWLES